MVVFVLVVLGGVSDPSVPLVRFSLFVEEDSGRGGPPFPVLFGLRVPGS